jgi:hypothetical protein
MIAGRIAVWGAIEKRHQHFPYIIFHCSFVISLALLVSVLTGGGAMANEK